VVAGDAAFIFRFLGFFDRDGFAAAVADGPVAFGEAVADGDAFVENEAFAFPEIFFKRDGFEIFQDAAFEVVDFFESFGEHVGAGFFTADAAGAIHGDFFMFGGVEVFFHVVFEIGEVF